MAVNQIKLRLLHERERERERERDVRDVSVCSAQVRAGFRPASPHCHEGAHCR